MSPMLPYRSPRHPSLFVVLSCLLASLVLPAWSAGEASPENLARGATVSVSSTRDPYVKDLVNDGDTSTSWSTALGHVSGEWLQLEWKSPQRICGVVMRQTGLYLKSVEISVLQDGKWAAVGRVGGEGATVPLNAALEFAPVTAESIRLSFDGGAAFRELEVYGDPVYMRRMVEEAGRMDIAVAGDLRGHLIGTVSNGNGTNGIIGAQVEVSGDSKLGAWRRSTVAGEDGFFSVDLPLGATGRIDVTARKDALSGQTSVESADLSRRLTPRPSERSQDRVNLDGLWDFAPDPPASFPASDTEIHWSKLKVPAHWEMEGFRAETGRAVYRRTFRVPERWSGRRVKLRAEAIYHHADIWVNGVRVGGHEGGTTPFELDITDAVKPAQDNTVVVLVTARSWTAKLDNYSFFSYFELAGIWRPIEVFAVEPTHVSRLAVDTRFDADYKDADLHVDLDVSNESQTGVDGAKIRSRVYDPSGKEVEVTGLASDLSVGAWESKSVSLTARVPSPLRWNAEQPRMYRLVTDLTCPGQPKRSIVQEFGFRQVEIKGRVFYLNGRPIKFMGVSRLEASPLEGRALSRETIRRDVELMKAANINAVRMTISPPDSYTLDLTDRYGMYVEDEGAFCWADLSDDLRYVPFVIGVSSEYLERDRNHPSVLLWSICNESPFGRGFRMVHEIFRREDPSRPTSAAQSADLEVSTLHNPTSMARIEATRDAAMPVLFDEAIAAFHGWGMADAMDQDPGIRDYWVTGPLSTMPYVMAGEQYLGVQLFSWVDDTFLVPGKAISCSRKGSNRIQYVDQLYKLPGRGYVGDYVWGIVDGWRRVRPEWWLTKKLYSPVRVEEKPLPIPGKGEPIVVPVENRNVFTDLAQYTCKWRLGSEIGVVVCHVEPQGRGSVRISTQSPPTRDSELVLEFMDAKGELVDGYRLAFKPHEPQQAVPSGRPPRIVKALDPHPADWRDHEYLEMASPIRLIGRDNTELSFDITSGLMDRCLRNREMVMRTGPMLHVMLNSSPLQPNPSGWWLTSSDARVEDGMAVVDWKGEYGKDFVGGFTFRSDDSGLLYIDYEFTYHGPEITTREVGLSFEVPLEFDRLEWDRRSEWSYYPDDHIGRPHGVAVAHPKAQQSTPPGRRPYGLDDHAWGSNDFRGTKRNVYWATLTDPRGYGVKVISDGTQHVRATVGVHGIGVKVLDYYGGSASGINEYDGLYGSGRALKPGDIVKGRIRLQLLAGTGK